ncbi:MAG: MarR family winged helix-turn-helix transcriptional regulator [Pseudomonadota bacterium]
MPIGLLLVQTAKAVGRAFDDALAAKGGSRPVWLILLALMDGAHRTQADLAATIGVRGPTLTHHLSGMERNGLLTRERLPENRRVQVVVLTAKGRALFHKLRQAVMSFDRELNGRFTTAEMDTLRGLLGRLGASDTMGLGPDL